MGDGDGELEWLDYRQAAARVSKTTRTISRWRREGMPMRLGRDGQQRVDVDTLLAWFRQSLLSSPTHYYRMRAIARAEGRPDPAPPEALTKPRRPKREPLATAVDVAELAPAPASAPTMPTLTRGANQYAALQTALRRCEPSCAGDVRFTADRVLPDDLRAMRALCAECPLRAACAAFAAAAKPTAGYWAGC